MPSKLSLGEKLGKVSLIYLFRILGKLVFPLVSILLLSTIVPCCVSDVWNAFGLLPSVTVRSSNTNRVTKQKLSHSPGVQGKLAEVSVRNLCGKSRIKKSNFSKMIFKNDFLSEEKSGVFWF